MMRSPYFERLTLQKYHKSLQILSDKDHDLARILKTFGSPLIWEREPGFSTLVQIILEQQVSLASAEAAFNRLIKAVIPLTPVGFLELDDASLKIIGFSRQKTFYCRELALSILAGRLDLDALEEMDDPSVREALIAQKGIGAWSAEIYLLMALLRPDAWPASDLALIKAVQKVKCLPSLPSPEQIEEISTAWRPHRAVAARLLWHYYLENRK